MCDTNDEGGDDLANDADDENDEGNASDLGDIFKPST